MPLAETKFALEALILGQIFIFRKISQPPEGVYLLNIRIPGIGLELACN